MIFRWSRQARTRKRAKEWLQLSDKALHYRKDILDAEALGALTSARERLRGDLKALAAPERLEASIEQLEAVLRTVGGSHYPRTWIVEFVETVVVAGILAIGVKTFFLQPMKIPTNSMYPTYHGLTYVLEEDAADRPNLLERAARKVMTWSEYRHVEAEASGELSLVIQRSVDRPVDFIFPVVRQKDLRPYLPVFRGRSDVYLLFIGDTLQELTVPAEFEASSLLMDWLGQQGVEPRDLSTAVATIGGRSVEVLRTGLTFEAGDPLLSFRIDTGDQVFVDRMSYHFVQPKVGDPFVFDTDGVPGISEPFKEMYYIKRIAGQPGDTLRIEPPVLYRNGAPADADAAFVANNTQEGDYEGYIHPEASRPALLPLRHETPLGPGDYVALGDNSDRSSDSRIWGFVPEETIVGRAFFIYYPFTGRWGPAE